MLNLLRDILVREETSTGGGGGGGLSLWHGAPQEWRVGDALSMRGMPTRLGGAISVNASWGSARSSFAISFGSPDHDGATMAAPPISLRMHVGSCEQASVQMVISAGGATSVECEQGASGAAVMRVVLGASVLVVIDHNHTL